MTRHDIEQFLELERGVWQALADGDGAADERLLSDDFLGVYTVGFAGRDADVAQLADGPTVSTFSLSDARLMVLADDMVLLAYRAEFTRPGEDGSESVLISSIWQDRDGGWVNIFSQDTPSVEGLDELTWQAGENGRRGQAAGVSTGGGAEYDFPTVDREHDPAHRGRAMRDRHRQCVIAEPLGQSVGVAPQLDARELDDACAVGHFHLTGMGRLGTPLDEERARRIGGGLLHAGQLPLEHATIRRRS